jgi:hypothetical protein
MAGKVFFSVSTSLDGFSAPESMEGILATPEQREQDCCRTLKMSMTASLSMSI